jgi:hypothetical protein
MESKTFDEMIDWLEAEKNYNVSEGSKAMYWDAFSGVDDGKFRAAIKVVAVEVRSFPTIGEIRRLIARMGEPKRTSTGRVHTHDGAAMSREVSEMMRRLDAGEITREDYLYEMRLMDEKYPGLGWRDSADDYERFLKKFNARRESDGQG